MIEGFPPHSKYKVLIRCNTFNQSKYIEETLRGFARQQTDFPFLVYVIDDASTDGEQEILRKWIENRCQQEDVKTYDNNLSIILMAKDKDNEKCIYAFHLLKQNLYMKPEKQALHECWRKQSEYEAMCEGDDYWIDPLKLHKQVSFLDNNKDYGMCYTKCQRLDDTTGEFVDEAWGGCNETFEEFTEGNTVPTLTAVFKISAVNRYYDTIQPVKRGWKTGDYPMWLYLSHESKVKFMNNVTGVYRIVENSASHFNNSKKYIEFINSSIEIVSYFWTLFKVDGNWEEYLRRRYSRLATNLMFLYNDRSGALRVLSSIKKKTYKEHLKYFVINNNLVYYLYRKVLKK